MVVWFIFGFMCAVILTLTAVYFKLSELRKAVLLSQMRLVVQRKNRWELIPSLSLSAAAVPGLGRSFSYALNQLKEKCAQGDTLAKQIACEAELSKTLHELFLQAAKHEELATDEHFKHLRENLIAVEGRIEQGKKRYNSAVRDFNTLAQVGPLKIMAHLLEFEPFEYFDFDKSL